MKLGSFALKYEPADQHGLDRTIQHQHDEHTRPSGASNTHRRSGASDMYRRRFFPPMPTCRPLDCALCPKTKVRSLVKSALARCTSRLAMTKSSQSAAVSLWAGVCPKQQLEMECEEDRCACGGGSVHHEDAVEVADRRLDFCDVAGLGIHGRELVAEPYQQLALSPSNIARPRLEAKLRQRAATSEAVSTSSECRTPGSSSRQREPTPHVEQLPRVLR